ncbi:hypothetical protein HF325_001137 [Metschnikowia pulcherrima]|uniref:Uncharacterized protein n=1 Tax=Metschnikowia pulcherrima TaxID=27326 RepID=A0A8H7LCS4_9ASCO|nr:hypothetical protein HF325_001137 [Metschnikowia pulcherrima]
MDSFDGQDFTGVFKAANLAVGSLAVIYTFIGASINGSSWFRLLASLLIFVVGLIFIVLEAIPSISPPENMNPEGISIGIQDENIV